MATVDSMLRAVLFFEMGNAGWQELYWLNPSISTYLQALDVAKNLAYYRTAFIGSGVSITFVRVSNSDSTRDGMVCQLPYPLGPHPSWQQSGTGPDVLGTPEDPFTAAMTRFETAQARWGNRFWRGCVDAWFTNKAILYPQYFTPAPANTPFVDPTPAGNANHLSICQYFWLYYMANVPLVKRLFGGQLSYDTLAYMTPIKVTRRITGRPFGISRGRRASNVIQGG